MAEHQHISVADLPVDGERLDRSRVGVLSKLLLLVGVVGTVISMILFFSGSKMTEYFAYSWLWALTFSFTLCVGGLFWSLLHHAINAGWGVSVRRIWVQLANIAPLLFLASLPLLLLKIPREALWEWMGEHRKAGEYIKHHSEDYVGKSLDKEGYFAEHNRLLYEKFEYLNMQAFDGIVPGWWMRFIIYFAIFIAGAYLIRNFSLKQELDGDVKHTFSARRFACGWIPLMAIAVSFWAIDWLKALDYAWFSTMWGVYIFAGCAWSSMALSIITVTWLRSMGYLQKVVTMEHYHLMGKLLFAFTVFWAYIAFDQFFLIWYANITEETKFFLIRNSGGWWWISLLLVFGHFGIPFLILLQAWLKKRPTLISAVAVWVLLMHAVDLYWIIIPERGVSVMGPDKIGQLAPGGIFLDLLAFISLTSLSAWFFIRNLGQHSLYPWRDPRLQESIDVSN